MALNKDLGCKWNFQERRPASISQSREDSSFAPFINNKLRCLVREYIQNSMDAYSKLIPNPVVEVHFETGRLCYDDYPELIGSLRRRLVACSNHCKSYPNGKDPYQSKVEYLDEHKDSSIGYLKVSDYNTRGMSFIDDDDQTSPFRACVRESSASFKPDRSAGGSHGLGKTVGFVNSGINAVYYSTMDEDGNTYGEGIIKLCDHKLVLEDGSSMKYEATAFYDSCDGVRPDSGTDIPEIFRRTAVGTDAFVLGIEVSELDLTTMKQEIIRSFFKAIYENKLAVVVGGERIDKNNLEEKLVEYFNDEEYGAYDKLRTSEPWLRFNPRPYCLEVLKNKGVDENHIVLNTTVDFPDRFPSLGDATLLLWKSEDIKASGSRDSIVYMRDNSMVIEVRRGSNNKGYYGICICDGSGSESLRLLENVTHDKWDEAELRDLSKEEQKSAKDTLKALKGFIKACEEKVFPEEIDQEEDIHSLKRRRLGIDDRTNSDNDADSAWPTTNVTTGSKEGKSGESSVTILNTKAGGKKKRKSKGKQTDPLPPAVPGGKPGPYPPKPEDEVPNPEDMTEKKPSTPGVDDYGDEQGGRYEDITRGKHMQEIQLDGSCRRLIPLHDGEFACKIAIKVPKDYEGCKMVLSIQAVSGKIPLRLKRVSDGCKITGIYNNEISGFDLSQDSINVIKFTPVESIKNYSLIIEAYGY